MEKALLLKNAFMFELHLSYNYNFQWFSTLVVYFMISVLFGIRPISYILKIVLTNARLTLSKRKDIPDFWGGPQILSSHSVQLTL